MGAWWDKPRERYWIRKKDWRRYGSVKAFAGMLKYQTTSIYRHKWSFNFHVRLLNSCIKMNKLTLENMQQNLWNHCPVRSIDKSTFCVVSL